MSGMFNILIVLLLLFNGGGSEKLKDGEPKDINCYPGQQEQTVFWFRLKDNEMFEFIGAFSSLGDNKTTMDNKKYQYDKKTKNTLKLIEFNKEHDSGSYICMSIKSNMLYFGKVTKLQGIPDPKPVVTVIPTTRAAQNLTAKPTPSCEKSGEVKTKPSVAAVFGCELIILIPLAVGSGLLLILLIITILYCNNIRTRRCPHHYKRHHQNRPAGHRPLPNKTEFYPM